MVGSPAALQAAPVEPDDGRGSFVLAPLAVTCAPGAPPRQPKNNSPRSTDPVPSAWPLAAPTEDEAVRGFTRSTRACLSGAWSMLTVSKQTGAAGAVRFRCKSWRCPECRYGVARQDFARILEALSSKAARSAQWVLLTLTFNPRKYASQWDAFKAGGPAWQKLRQRLARFYGSPGRPARISYVAVWERHKSGWPHVHIALSCAELVQHIRDLGTCVADVDGFGSRRWDSRANKHLPNWAWKPRVLDDLAQECGFGRVSDVQFPRAKEGGVAGYFAKLSAELVGMFDQRPVNAPRHFRRLRSSRGTLPPRHRPTGEFFGRLVKQPHALVCANLLRERWPAHALPRNPLRLIELWRSTPRSPVRTAARRFSFEASYFTRLLAAARAAPPGARVTLPPPQ